MFSGKLFGTPIESECKRRQHCQMGSQITYTVSLRNMTWNSVVSSLCCKDLVKANTAQKRCGADVEYVELIDQPIETASKSLHDVNATGAVYINSEDDVKEVEDSQKLDIIMTDLQKVKNNLSLLMTAQGKSSKGKDIIETKAVQQNDEKFDEEMDTLLAKVTLAISIAEIEQTGLVYDPSKNELRCLVCAIPQLAAEDSPAMHTDSLTGVFAYKQKTGLVIFRVQKTEKTFKKTHQEI